MPCVLADWSVTVEEAEADGVPHTLTAPGVPKSPLPKVVPAVHQFEPEEPASGDESCIEEPAVLGKVEVS